MDRSFARLAAALVLGAALTACSTFDAGSTASAPKKEAAAKPADSKTLAADLETQVRNAQALRLKGDYQGATQILSQLMLVAPDSPGVVGEYGKTLVGEGRSKDALDFLKRAAQLSPRDWSVYSATGVAYDQSGDYANAKLAYQQALALKPGDAGVLNNYALSRLQAGDTAGARQLMAQAQASGASDPKIAQNVALIASYAPAEPAPKAALPSAPPPAATAPKTAVARAMPAPQKQLPPTVMMQQIPTDPKAGPVKVANGAPRKLATPAASAPPKPNVAAAAPSKTAIAAAAPKKDAKVAAAPSQPKKTAEAEKSAKTKTPALRMTADAGTP